MENPKFLRKNAFATVKAAIWGGLMFAGITLIIVAGHEYWGWRSREGPEVSVILVGAGALFWQAALKGIHD